MGWNTEKTDWLQHHLGGVTSGEVESLQNSIVNHALPTKITVL